MKLVKLKRLIGYFWGCIFCFIFLATPVYAQTVTVTATLPPNTDPDEFNSTFYLSSNIANPGEKVDLHLHVTDLNGNPLGGYTFNVLGLDGCYTIYRTKYTNLSGNAIYSFSCNNSGNYNVQLEIITPIDHSFFLSHVDPLYITNLPVINLQQEEEFTYGSTNTIYWESNLRCSNYDVQSSQTSDFSRNVFYIEKISDNSFTFQDLKLNQIYYYRVRCVNTWGVKGKWSNTVSSIQVSPFVEVYLDDVRFNSAVETFEIVIDADWSNVDSIEIWYQKGDGDFALVGTVSNTSLYSVNIKDLPFIDLNNLNGRYSFKLVYFSKILLKKGETDPKYVSVDQYDIKHIQQVENSPISKVIENTINNLKDVVGKTADKINDQIFEIVNNLDESEKKTVEVTNYAVVVVNSFFLLNGLNIIYYVQLANNFLIIIGLLKKPKKQGVIYNSITKEPISRAVVRIVNQQNKVLRTCVSDSHGYFYFWEVSELFKLKIRAKGYVFPSQIISGKVDIPYDNVLGFDRSDKFFKSNQFFSVPLDPVEYKKNQKYIAKLRNVFWNIALNFNWLLIFVGLVLSILTYYINPSILSKSFILLTLAILIIKLVGYFLILKKRKGSKILRSNGDPVNGLVIDVWDIDYNQLFARRITDQKGRFRLSLPKGRYKLVINSVMYRFVDNIYKNGILIMNPKNTEMILSKKIFVEII